MLKQETAMNAVQPEMLNVADIFNHVEYVVPIYQRNYAWEKDQIEQLIQDIQDVAENVEEYYLGNLIVNKFGNKFEVIDGQQRLTTLYLMMLCLNRLMAKYGISQEMIVPEGALSFEAREKSNDTFRRMKKNESDDEWTSEELKAGYNIISNYFNLHFVTKEKIRKFVDNLKKVKIVRVQVPEGIDLNHYFEIMNTRGEQLMPHEIAKARILAKLNGANLDKKVVEAAAQIWDACALMDSYVQMNFDTESRKNLFGESWTEFRCDSFDKAVELCITDEQIDKTKQNKSAQAENEKLPFVLGDFLKDGAILRESDKSKSTPKEEQERFESVINFPNFLLQVNAFNSKDSNASLDDKDFLETLKPYWEDVEKAKEFIFKMLRCRYLFDKFIIKREFYKDYRDEGRWMLQAMKAYEDKKKKTLKPQYYGTYNTTVAENLDSDDDKTRYDNERTKQTRMLEACLRITYTSPKMMHWITEVLSFLDKDEKTNLIPVLENYCRQKVKESDYTQKSGFGIERIVFTYLDYLLWRDGYSYEDKTIIGKMENFHYQYRNSIEHFSPQHPAERKAWNDADLNSFGNLALVTVSGNSKFSNNEPAGKIKGFASVVSQSLKLKVMAEMTKSNNDDWTVDLSNKHQDEMDRIIQSDIVKIDVNYN